MSRFGEDILLHSMKFFVLVLELCVFGTFLWILNRMDIYFCIMRVYSFDVYEYPL